MHAMDYPEILTLCEQEQPDLIYVAIGCAAYEHPSSQGTIQQYPPFVKHWSGKKVCIWIDPDLESPPRSLTTIQATPDSSSTEIWRTTDAIFVSVRKHFYYEATEESQFIESLCRNTVARHTKLIVQDYSGRDIQEFYPMHIHPDIPKSVLYDVTYNDGGCFIDFDAIQILRDANGDFLQPSFSPLRDMYGNIPDLIFEKELTRRRQNLTNIHTYNCIVRGLRESNSWTTEDRIAKAAHRYASIYRVYPTDYEGILFGAAKDLCATASCFLTPAEIDQIISSPSQQYAMLFQNLQVVLKIPAQS